jgi:hypothetical protein
MNAPIYLFVFGSLKLHSHLASSQHLIPPHLFYRVGIRCQSLLLRLKTHQSKQDQPGETATRAGW